MSKKNKTESVTFRLNTELKEKLMFILEKEDKIFSQYLRAEARKIIENFEKENGPIKLDQKL